MSRRLTASNAVASHTEMLRSILEHAQNPELLDDHPWIGGLIVSDAIQRDPMLLHLKPGERLLAVIGNLFTQMMPGMPPRRGVRLDTRWGEFGILAARYFAPLRFGIPFPPTLRDAWGRIDQAIQLYVFGHEDGSVSDELKAHYCLVGGEPEVAAPSTLSDWHKKGIQRLANIVREKESHLQRLGFESLDIGGEKQSYMTGKSKRPRIKRLVFSAILSLFLLVFFAAGVKAYRIYILAEKVKQEALALEVALPSSPDLQSLKRTIDLLPAMNHDLDLLQVEVEPVLWLGPWLRWVPIYGGDLAQAGSLLDLARHLILSSQETGAALSPILENSSGAKPASFAEISVLLSDASPKLLDAQAELQKAQESRNQINPDQLSKQIRDLIVQRIDPGMSWMNDGLSLAIAMPSVLGAAQQGPKTYLLLVQNEDELRSTGGFITAVGKLVLDQGNIISLSFDDSGALDNWSMPYPLAPWQLSQYMNSRVLILRDANWFPNFPTASLYVEQLYAYTHQNSVNGVIAFDQHFLVMLLKTMGPLTVDGAPYPITADNVISYMRAAKSPELGKPLSPGGDNKIFISTIAEAMVRTILSRGPSEWGALSTTFLQALEQRHLILQMDTQDMETVLARRDWNGALQSTQGDFLSVIDSNVGFNKTNAVVDTSLAYDVNLTDPSAPVSELLVSHTNHAQADVPCIQWSEDGTITAESDYPIDRCYWDYMRVYVPQGARLLSATPETIPDAWMIMNQHVPPRVDVLDEGLQGLQSFGTMIVVPGGQTVNTGLRFALPAGRILSQNVNHVFTYQLTIRKQPGTLDIPLTVRIHLPSNATLESGSPDWIVDGEDILIQTNLKVDAHLKIDFSLP